MALWIDNPDKQKYLSDYFKSLNSIAMRFMETRENIKEKYDGNWNELTPEEQEKVIDDKIIPQSVRDKYASIKTPLAESNKNNFISVFPALRIETGQRKVATAVNNDDSDNEKGEEVYWMDEHSDPFSWETRSQMNIIIPPADPQTRKQLKATSNATSTEAKVIDKTQVKLDFVSSKDGSDRLTPEKFNYLSTENNSNNSYLSAPKDFPKITKQLPQKQQQVSQSSVSAPVSKILEELDTKPAAKDNVTITLSTLDGENSEIEVSTAMYGSSSSDLKKDSYQSSKASKSKDVDEQFLLPNAQDMDDSTPSAEKPRLSGFDFLDNW